MLALALIAPLIAGCATFSTTRRLDVGPFAENTVLMIGEVQRATKPVVWIHLQKYSSLPSVMDTRRATEPARSLMRGVALYSTQLVSIYASDLPDRSKTAELSRYLDAAIRTRIESNPAAESFITQQSLDSAVAKVRNADKFMTALARAQPVISAALSYGNVVFDSLDMKIDVAATDIGNRIEADFAPLKVQIAALTDLQLRATRGYTLLSRYRLGDPSALDTLRAQDPEAAATLGAGRRPTASAVDAVEKRLLSQLRTMASLRTDLLEELAVYEAQHVELDQLRNEAQEASRLGRITLIMWARSHRNLAAGVRVPAAIDVMGMVRNAAGHASGSIVP